MNTASHSRNTGGQKIQRETDCGRQRGRGRKKPFNDSDGYMSEGVEEIKRCTAPSCPRYLVWKNRR